MVVLHSNYPELSDFTAALNYSLAVEGDIYVTRTEYALARTCQRDDYFINLLQHQRYNGSLEQNTWQGFDGYTLPQPTFALIYIDGLLTTTSGSPPTTYQAGDTLTISITGSSVSLVGVEVQIVVLGVTYSAIAGSDGIATFSVTLPSTASGDITINSQVAFAEELIQLGYHAEAWDSSYPVRTSDDFGPLSFGVYAIGDTDANDAVTGADFIASLGQYGTAFRLKATNFFTVTLGASTYYPTINAYSTLTYVLTPTAQDYTYTDGEGEAKELVDLTWNVAVGDIGDGLPSAYQQVVGASATLNADGTYSGTLSLSPDYVGALAVVFSATQALNDFTSTGDLTIGSTVISVPLNQRFEPGGTVTVQIAASNTGLDYENTIIKIADSTGEFEELIAVPAQGVTQSFTITIPDSIDRDLEAVLSVYASIRNNSVHLLSPNYPSFFSPYYAVLDAPYYDDTQSIVVTVTDVLGTLPLAEVNLSLDLGGFLAWDTQPGSGVIGVYTAVVPEGSGNVTVICNLL